MIRHTPSFFISIIIHLLLLVAFLYTYKYVSSLSGKKDDKKVCLMLSCVVAKHVEPVKEKSIPKKTVPKTIEPKVKKPKKEVVEKIIPKPFTVPVVKEIVEPEVESEIVNVEMLEEQENEVPLLEFQEEQEVAQEEQYMDENIKKIVRLLSENLYYPRSARKRGVTGEVVVKFCLAKDATVSSVEIVSSKSEILSRAAKKTILDLSGEFPKPSQELVLHVPIMYELKR